MLKEFTVVFDIPDEVGATGITIIGEGLETVLSQTFGWYRDVRWEIPYNPKIALMISPS